MRWNPLVALAAPGDPVDNTAKEWPAGRLTIMFTVTERLLHWLMATAILTMLFVGIGIVASVSPRHEWLLRIDS